MLKKLNEIVSSNDSRWYNISDAHLITNVFNKCARWSEVDGMIIMAKREEEEKDANCSAEVCVAQRYYVFQGVGLDYSPQKLETNAVKPLTH